MKTIISKQLKKINMKKVMLVVLCVIVGFLSFHNLAKISTNQKNHKATIKELDEKKANVLKMTASAAAASTALAAVPGDATTPVANKLADFSSYFLVLLIVIFVEKYLVTLTGLVSFKILIPLACALFAIAIISGKNFLHAIAAKLVIFALVIFTIIPLSMKVSTIVEETNQISAEATMKEANELADEIKENTNDEGTVIDKFLKKIKGGVSSFVTKGEALVNNFIEMIAVMFVTSCVIPILVLLCVVWVIKILFGIQITIPEQARKRFRVGKRKGNDASPL